MGENSPPQAGEQGGEEKSSGREHSPHTDVSFDPGEGEIIISQQRPHPAINQPNLALALRAHAKKNLARFTSHEGVVGVTLTGGVSRGYADQLSEVDVTLYLTPETYDSWGRGQAPVPVGIVIIDGMLYDVKLVNAATEAERDWGDVDRWDASYAEILHDPAGIVAELFSDKCQWPSNPETARGHLSSSWWYYRLAADIWLYRQDPLQCHLVLNHAVEKLTAALFAANNEFVPHEKWLLHFSRSLTWQPGNWPKRIADALTVEAPTLETARRRQRSIAELWDEIDRFVIEKCCPDYPLQLMHKRHYDLLQMLVERGEVSAAEWQEHADLSVLNGPPFYLCVEVDGDRVRLDRERLNSIRPEDLYEWYFEVVKAVR